MPRSDFDPYAGMSPAEREAIKRPPGGGGPRQFPQHRVEGGKVFRNGQTAEVPVKLCKMRCDQLTNRVRELDRQIEKLQEERQAHLDQAAHLDDIVKQVEG